MNAAPTGVCTPTYLLGRCANGFERDKGRVVHLLPNGTSVALCGATYGRRSAGWHRVYPDDMPMTATCKKCMAKHRHMPKV